MEGMAIIHYDRSFGVLPLQKLLGAEAGRESMEGTKRVPLSCQADIFKAVSLSLPLEKISITDLSSGL